MQLTHDRGSVPIESPDGKVVYYQKGADPSEVWEVPATGGKERRVLGPAGYLAFEVVEDGIYFIEPGPPDTRVGLRGTR